MSVIDCLKKKEEVLWLNPDLSHVEPHDKIEGYGFVYMKAAQNRFMRFLPYIASAFPETAEKKGVIESALLPISKMKEYLNEQGAGITGSVYLKDDAHMPIAGSVKARGGIHEVLCIAESIGQQAGMLHPTDNYGKIDSEEFRDLYGQYTIQVGSTGNLGLSIGRTAAKLGFKVIVHMSSDAKEWKKDLLRKEGVTVKEYDGDYSQAVAKGREESDANEKSFFIDDENSKDLFFGYSTAGMRLTVQLRKLGIPVDKKHPLFVYLPCGVGGAPGGITFGLKQMFGDNVHCFFAEPVEAPCVTLGMASGQGNEISVQDIGLSGKTIADGLAVGRPSGLVCQMMKGILSGSYTVNDEKLPVYQKELWEKEEIFIEPSACAGFAGVAQIEKANSGWEEYLKEHDLLDSMYQATHVIWATGGGLMPEEERGLLSI
ncbi:MAG: D-serine ammonia-lyase [Eubacteriales bacterium]|nr:D-serine ammonia-lyase [Eubacteriales bacterium]